MPASAPAIPDTVAERLGRLGERIRARRKGLGVSAEALAEVAGMSRITLHRIERGQASVTIGAYLNAMDALGLGLDVTVDVVAAARPVRSSPPALADGDALPDRIRLSDYAQLRQLAWHAPGASELTPEEALALYERNWRHIDNARMLPEERRLVECLVQALGHGHLLV